MSKKTIKVTDLREEIKGEDYMSMDVDFESFWASLKPRSKTPLPRRKKFCKRGHLRTPDNVKPDGGCRSCAKLNGAIWRARLKAEKHGER